LNLDGKTYDVPSTWEECNQYQLLRLAELLFASHLSFQERRVKAILILLNVRHRFWLRLKFFFRVTSVHIADMLPLTDWVFETPYTDDRNRFQYIKLWYGPKDGLRHFTYIEWIKAEQYYRLFWEDKELTWLHHLTAVLYRDRKPILEILSKKWDGMSIEPYNDASFPKRVRKMAKLPLGYHYITLLFYSACREGIINDQSYNRVFNRTSGSEGGPVQDPYIPLLREMAGSPRQEDLESYGQALLSDVLADWQLKLEKKAQSK